MEKAMLRASVLTWVLLLIACSSQPLYSPASRDGTPGYFETRLTENRYRVTFTGSANTSGETVKNLAMLRAAELTTGAGYDWFRIVARDTEERSRRNEPRFSVGIGSGCYPFGCRVLGSRWYTGVGVDSIREQDRYRSSLEIQMGKGESPDPTSTYNAKELAQYLRSSEKVALPGADSKRDPALD